MNGGGIFHNIRQDENGDDAHSRRGSRQPSEERTPLEPMETDDDNVKEEVATTSETDFNKDDIIQLNGHASEVFVCSWNPGKPWLLATGYQI